MNPEHESVFGGVFFLFGEGGKGGGEYTVLSFRIRPPPLFLPRLRSAFFFILHLLLTHEIFFLLLLSLLLLLNTNYYHRSSIIHLIGSWSHPLYGYIFIYIYIRIIHP